MLVGAENVGMLLKMMILPKLITILQLPITNNKAIINVVWATKINAPLVVLVGYVCKTSWRGFLPYVIITHANNKIFKTRLRTSSNILTFVRLPLTADAHIISSIIQFLNIQIQVWGFGTAEFSKRPTDSKNMSRNGNRDGLYGPGFT